MIGRPALDLLVLEAFDILDAAHDRPDAILGREEDVRLVGKLQRSVFPLAGEDIGCPGLVADGHQLERDRPIHHLGLKGCPHAVRPPQIPLGAEKADVAPGVDERLSLHVEREMDRRCFGEAFARHLEQRGRRGRRFGSDCLVLGGATRAKGQNAARAQEVQEPASGQRQRVSFAPPVRTVGSNRRVASESSTRSFATDARRRCGQTRVLPSGRPMKPAGDEHDRERVTESC